jgi:hypothetical protein
MFYVLLGLFGSGLCIWYMFYTIYTIVRISELKQLYCVHYDTYTSKFVVYYFYACLLY